MRACLSHMIWALLLIDRAGVIRKVRALGEFNGMDGTRI